MGKRAISTLMLTLLVTSMLTLAFNILPVKAEGTIYIRADGSIDPPTAPMQRDGNVYTFTADIYDPIAVERNNIIIDGNAYTLQGTGASNGIDLSGRTNVTVRNAQIKNFNCGIYLRMSSNNSISGNNLTANNWYGIDLDAWSDYNDISGNNLTANIRYGALLISWSNYNSISGNNIANNSEGVFLVFYCNYNSISGNNITNNGYGIDIGGDTGTSRCNYNSISGNNIANNSRGGIYLVFSSNSNTISGNSIIANYIGILLDDTSSNLIRRNSIMNNDLGIWLCPSNYTSITENNVTNNTDGMYLADSSNNIISKNNITNNKYGVTLNSCTNNKLYHNNFIRETQHASVYSSLINVWDNGYPSGGNYWSDYSDVDLNNDGIWDHPHAIGVNNSDRYPLVHPWTPTPPAPDFSIMASPTSLTIQQGSLGSSTITVTSINGFDQPVQLSDSGTPSGVTATLNPQQTTPPPGGSTTSTLTVSVDTEATLGSYILTVTGTNGTQTHSLDIPLEITVTPPPPNQPPTCIIKLQKDGVEISEIGVGEFFDIYAGGSSDDTRIKQVRFSNDDVRDGKPTGRWTEWYDWHTSSDDWDALTKIRRWAFYSPGYKEVWAEVIDEAGQTVTCSADMIAPAPALPVLVSPLIISPLKDMYSIGDSLTAEFTVENIGEAPITLDTLTLGGRLNGWIQADGYPDFTHRQVTLQPHVPYQYSGSLTLTQTGNYRFFIAYHIVDPDSEEKKLLDENNWNTCIELGEGLAQTARVKNIIVFEEGITPEEVSHLGETISRLTALNPYIPPYLLVMDSWKEKVATMWADFISWTSRTDLTGKYDELYSAGVEYLKLRSKVLSDAADALNRGDTIYAQKCVERSRTYDRLAYMSFVAASEVFDGMMDAAQTLVQGIREGCEGAVKLGIQVLFPSAGIVADGMYLIMNFGFNNYIEGENKTTIDLAVDTLFMAINAIEFPSLGFNTLETYANGASRREPFKDLLLNKEWLKEFGVETLAVATREVIIPMGIKISEVKLKEMVDRMVQYLVSMGDLGRTVAKCPVELRIQDSEGRVAGVVSGRVRQEIPLSLCYNGTVQIFFPSDSYSYELIGTGTGTYELAIALTEGGNTTTFNATGIPTSISAKHVYNINWTALSEGAEGATIQVDSNGDGVFEHTFTSGNELTREEFLSQTATTAAVDFDPHVLNLKSKGKWITGYIELPEGYDPANINVSTVMLNGTFSAELMPTAIGDHDNNSVPDLMIEFNKTAVAEFILSEGLITGNVTLTVTGNFMDGNLFQGSAVITVRMPGDVNVDGKVDGKDIAFAAMAFGTCPRDPRWNCVADENEDNKADGKDIVLIALNFGKAYP